MNLLLRSAKILDSNSSFHNKTADILISDGVIKEIKFNIKASGNVNVIETKNLYVSIGWFDMQANFRDPGYEWKEDLLSGSRAAIKGGFTGVAVMPSTHPPVHTKAEVEYVLNKTKNLAVDVLPIGTVSCKMEGKELSEMYDMFRSGAVAFSDDKNSISNAGLLMRALLYSKNFGGLVMTHCDEKTISMDGKMNEGKISTLLGLKGIPALAEEMMVARNIFLAEYCGARIHISSVSTSGAVQLIREAKKKKLKITCSVNAHHLAMDDSLLKSFDTNYKVNPPLRAKVDSEYLKKGLADGTIDCIASDHCPEDIESKQIEFDHAAFGMSGIETAFSLANMNRGKLSLSQLIEKIAVNPRKILNVPVPKIKAGEKANLTLFTPDENWAVEEKTLVSKSKNTPLIGKRLKGKVIAVCNNGQFERVN